MSREQLPIRYPEDGHRVADIIMEITERDAEFAARVRGANMRAIARYVDRDDDGHITREGYIIEATFTPEAQSEHIQRGWSVEREELLVPA